MLVKIILNHLGMYLQQFPKMVMIFIIQLRQQIQHQQQLLLIVVQTETSVATRLIV